MSNRRPAVLSGHPLPDQTLTSVRDPLGMYGDVVEACGDVARLSVLGLGEFSAPAHPDHVERGPDRRPRRVREDGPRWARASSPRRASGMARERESLEEFFYPARVRSDADRMVDLTERRLDRWTPGERLSLHEEMSGAALDNRFGTVFGRPLDPDGDERLRRAANGINRWFKPSSFALPAPVLTYALHHLGIHEAVRERFHAELDGRPTLDGAGDLSVTRRALDETMRLYPPVHTIPRGTTRTVEFDAMVTTQPADGVPARVRSR